MRDRELDMQLAGTKTGLSNLKNILTIKAQKEEVSTTEFERGYRAGLLSTIGEIDLILQNTDDALFDLETKEWKE